MGKGTCTINIGTCQLYDYFKDKDSFGKSWKPLKNFSQPILIVIWYHDVSERSIKAGMQYSFLKLMQNFIKIIVWTELLNCSELAAEHLSNTVRLLGKMSTWCNFQIVNLTSFESTERCSEFPRILWASVTPCTKTLIAFRTMFSFLKYPKHVPNDAFKLSFVSVCVCLGGVAQYLPASYIIHLCDCVCFFFFF